MALPTTPPIDFAQEMHNCPPFERNGDFYAIGLGDGVLDEIRAFKTSDPTLDANWTEQDAASNPDQTDGEDYRALAAVRDGDFIHIVTQHVDASGHTTVHPVEYHRFNLANDTWSVANEDVDSGPVAFPNHLNVAIAVRSGEPIVWYQDDPAGSMGSDFSRVSFNARFSGVWSGPTSMGTIGDADTHFRVCAAVLGAIDRTHVITSRADQGAGQQSVIHQSISSANALDTVDDFITMDATSRSGAGIPLAYNDGTVRIRWPLRLATTAYGGIAKFDSGANPTITLEDAQDAAALPLGLQGADQATIVLVRRSNGDLHLLYTEAATGRDLWHDVSLGGDGSWGTDVEVDTSDVDLGYFINATIYQRNGADKLAYLWEENAADINYNEIDLGALAAPPLEEILSRRRPTTQHIPV